MKTRNWFITAGVLAMTLVLGLTMLGCKSDDDNTSGNAPTTISGEQVYTSAGVEYTTSTAQIVVLKVYVGSTLTVVNENVGTISTDGKLTLNLPATVPDNYLEDVSAQSGVSGLKMADCSLYVGSSRLSLKKDSEDPLSYMYLNKGGSFTIDGKSISWSAGWSYSNFTTDATGYKWTIG